MERLEAAIRQARLEGIDVTVAEQCLISRLNDRQSAEETKEKAEEAKANTEMQLEASIFAARYDAFGDLVKMICMAKVIGLQVDHAETKLIALKAERKRKADTQKNLETAMLSVRPDATEELEAVVVVAEQEGLNVVQAQLLLLQMRNERRKVADASAHLVKIVQNVSYDGESLKSLEKAISEAIEGGVSAENVEKARQLLASLFAGKQLLDEALIDLQVAIKQRSLPMLLDAVSTASEIGFQHEQLQISVSTAKAIIIEIKSEEVEQSLQQSTEISTVDSFDNLVIAIERAKGSKVDSSMLLKAQIQLNDLRLKKQEKDEIFSSLRKAINGRDVEMILIALQAAAERDLGGQEVTCFFLFFLSF